jgi:hypothetical protein
MKKEYNVPTIDVVSYKAFESLANDNLFSDPWGFDEELTDEE